MPLLRLEHVAKNFGALKVIDDLSLSLDAGEALGIIGPNGAGKTTLFNLIAGDLRVSDRARFQKEGPRRHGAAGPCRAAAGSASRARIRSRIPSPT